MKSYLLAGSALIVLASAPAVAADLGQAYPTKAPPPVVVAAPLFSWTGFYLGANVGYGWGDSDASTYIDPVLYGTNFSPDGFVGGGQIGFNYQFENNVVLGVEADIEFGDLNDSLYLVDAGSIGGSDFDLSARVKTEYFGTVRARVGYAFDNVLPYVTGGLAWANTKLQSGLYFDPALDDIDAVTSSQDKTSYGWVVGAGLEYAFAQNWTAKVEYLYADLGSESYSANYLDDIYTADVDLKIQTVKFGVNYKF